MPQSLSPETKRIHEQTRILVQEAHRVSDEARATINALRIETFLEKTEVAAWSTRAAQVPSPDFHTPIESSIAVVANSMLGQADEGQLIEDTRAVDSAPLSVPSIEEENESNSANSRDPQLELVTSPDHSYILHDSFAMKQTHDDQPKEGFVGEVEAFPLFEPPAWHAVEGKEVPEDKGQEERDQDDCVVQPLQAAMPSSDPLF